MLTFFFFIFISNYDVINLSDFNGVYKIKSILNSNNILICNDIINVFLPIYLTQAIFLFYQKIFQNYFIIR